MKIERTKNASRNIAYGVLIKTYQIIMPFIMRTAIIYILGIQYLGLNSLFTSILNVLSLAELGVGSAMVYSMYKPIAEDNIPMICALMQLYKKYYRIIGLIILIAGLLLLPFLPHLVKTDTVPEDINLSILYLINLSATVVTYWMFAYKNCLLAAFQRTDIQNKIILAVSTISYIVQLAVLCFLHNYYIYTCILVSSALLNNLVTAWIVSKKYPDYHPKGSLPESEVKTINQRIKDLLTAKLGGTIVSSADSIVISAFLGLTILAVYQNYYFVVSSVIGFVLVLFSATTAGVGNSLVVETEEKNYWDFRKFAFLINWIAIVCISCFMSLYQPFIKLWVGENLMLDYSFVLLFCAYFYVFVIQQLACVYKDASGIWHSDRFRPLVSGVFNLGLNLLFVKRWGLYAIILSTIFSYVLIAMPWLIHNLFTTVFHRNSREYVVFILKGFAIAYIVGAICYFVCGFIRGSLVGQLLIRFVICTVLSNFLCILIYRKHELYNPMLELVDAVLKKKAHPVIQRLKTGV